MSAIDRLNAALSDRYRVEHELGEGGMATVYLARDLKHERQVAIKVLRPELAAVVGAERFLSEIKTTASLQHPHILSLHDSGEADGLLFYIMPYVEGESLRDKLDRERQLPVDEAVGIASDVAEALDHAHRKGVIHRDIKPANVLIHEGRPLVADFGIALAVGAAGGTRLTETGLSLGTPYYMSPEQATGDQPVGPTTDIYALGCVLYEMLVGDPPYQGSTAQAVLGKIIAGDGVEPRKTRASIPPNVDAVIRKALEKLPADRFGSASAFVEALSDPGFRAATLEGGASHARAGPAALSRPWGVFAALLAVAGGAFFAGRTTSPEPERTVARFRVGVPEEVNSITVCCGPAQTLSPDGEWLVFAGRGTGSRDALYRRRVGRLEAEAISGTAEGTNPFFSPDGRWIGFHSEGRIRKIPLTGGPPVPIAEVERIDGASWGDDDVIVFGVAGDALHTVPASGGTPTPVAGTEDAEYIQPWVLPGAEATLARIGGPLANQDARIVGVDLRTGEADTLAVATRAAYASGHLVFSAADGTLLAQPFDPEERRTTGQAVAILDGVSTANPPAMGEFALSTEGSLVYQTRGVDQVEQLIVHGEEGATPVPLTEPGDLEGPSFSPDGRRIAVSIAAQPSPLQIWIWHRDQRTQQRLTVGDGTAWPPVWSTDGSRIAFARTDTGTPRQMYWRPADGSGSAEQLLEVGGGAEPLQFSPDDRSLLFVAFTGAENRTSESSDIGLLDLDADSVRWIVVSDAEDYQGQISPDGRWLAYTSERSGQPEVYVQALDGSGGLTQISAGGGHSPRWSPDGGTLYFATGEGRPVIAARVTTDGDFRVTGREEAFEGPEDYNVPGNVNWDVSPDGQEFLYISRSGAGRITGGFVWVLGWPEIVRRMGAGEG